MGVAADSWLSFMDQLLTQKADSTEKECLLKKVIQLVDIYYDALDAPKTGKKVEVPSALKAERFPHYMEKATRSTTYKSTSVLGLIFDEVASQSYVCPPEDVWRKLPSFCYEPSPASLDFWKVQFSQYKSEMREALGLGHESKNLVADQIMLKYRKILYGAPEFESSTKSKEKVFDEALAIYHVVFEYANSYKDPGKFNFTWQVAGDALCALHVTKQENNSLRNLCNECALSPPDASARRRLRRVGEEEALLILKKIMSSANIKTLSGFIIYMVRQCSADKVGGSPTAASGTGVSAPQTPPGRCFSCGSPYARSSEKRPFSRVSCSRPDGSFTSARNLFTENNSSISRSVPAPAVTSPLLAEFDKLEFRNKLEDFVSLDMIGSIGTLQMTSFEVELWKAVGCRCISERDRIKFHPE